MRRQQSGELIRLLRAGGVDFVLIGGVAANLYGANHATFDVDVLMPFTEANWARAIAALEPIQPTFHGHGGRIPLHRDPKALIPFRMVLLDTLLGRLDILREIPGGTYADLAPRAISVTAFDGALQVLALDDLIESKAFLMREKDKPAVIELKAIRERLRAGIE